MMFTEKSKAAKSISLVMIFLLSIIYGCVSKEKKEERSVYRAINGKDTAILSLATSKNRFWGEYEIKYGKSGKDSGEVRGEFIGDTLRGTYKYLSFGGSLKQAPIALLKKNNKLHLGEGVVSSLMDMPIYVPDILIDYDNSGFIFEEIK